MANAPQSDTRRDELRQLAAVVAHAILARDSSTCFSTDEAARTRLAQAAVRTASAIQDALDEATKQA